MKVPFILLAVCLSIQVSYSQTGIVKGRVIDARSFKPLPFATVYMNQTTIGSVTNNNGDFVIQNIPVGRYDLVVSYVGYQAYQSRVIVNDSIPVTMSIKLSPSTTNLNEILVRGKKDNAWVALYEKFQRHFFGVSPYTSECRIVNPWVLDFIEDNNGILTASASLPIEIENLGLGYTITCQLKDFAAGANLYKINGTYRFLEAHTSDTILAELWHSRREDVYHGSARHLLKAVVEKKAEAQGFQMYLDKSNNPEVIRNSNFLTNLNSVLLPVASDSITLPSTTAGQYIIEMPSRTEVHYVNKSVAPKIYRNVPNPVSWIEVKGGSLEVTETGIVLNPNRMTIAGAMGDAHIAELLPLDYQPVENALVAPAIKKKIYSRLAALLEKPYIMTDKPYYYPADAILFKSYFNYISPVYRDSLSHVMNVELIDASGKIVQKKMFPVIAGTAVGDLMLPVTTRPGDYTLRAYTRWMMNFDKQVIFTKDIKILGVDQLAKVNDFKLQVKQLQVLTEKDEYETRESITVAVEATNYYRNIVAADLAVTVTDLEQSAIPYDEKTILSDFPFTKDMLPDTSLKNPTYMIQYGIDFKGRLVTGKKNKAAGGVLTVYQDRIDDVFAIPTDETGNFHKELQLIDSVELLIASKTLKGRQAKVIVEEIKQPVPEVEPGHQLKLDLYKPSDPLKYHVIDLYSTAKMLETVTIEAKKIERISADKKHIMSDSHIDGDYLRATNATDLLSALRGRVPGLQVTYAKDYETGMVKKYIRFPGLLAIDGGASECLVEVDGVVLTSINESVAEQLEAMSVSDVESIDVLRFGSAAAYGARAANGVIVIKTRMGEKPAGPRLLDRSKLQVVSLAGYSTAEEFVSPDYSAHTSGDERMDLRSTIYWNPFVITDGKEPAKVSFYAADVPTRYRIVVEGVTAEGEPVRGEKIIVVRSKK